ncbi:hypothetical protein DDT91_12200, partial [Algoriphagus sp. AK58]|nr:hypothetical protein [Algoriphagus sp. AK58]
VGEEISYDITVTNDGNVTLKGIVVTDPLTGLNQVIASLAPQADTVIVTKYVITQADLDAGKVDNTATASYEELERSADETVFASQTAALTILKEITSGNPYSLVDDVIEYKYTLTNTGNVTLSGPFTVEDDKIGTIADPANTSILAPNDELVFTASYTVVASDLANGSVTNIATGKGYFGEGVVESDPDQETADASFNEILAVDDNAGTFQYSTVAQTSTVNALTNDKLKGGPATSANVVLTTVTPDPTGTLTVDGDGVITIGANAQAGDYQLTYRITEVGNPSNFDEAVITVTVEPLLGLIEVDEYCELDAPYLRWLLSPVNFDLQDLAPGDDTPLTMTWYDKDGNVIISYDNIPLEGYMLFPGADTLPGGYGSSWPGWRYENMQWESGPFNFYQVREPGSYVIFRLNPEVQAEVTYPGATAECNPNPNPPIAEDDDMTGIPVSTQLGYDNIVNVLNNDRLLDGTTPLNTTLVTITEVSQSTPGALILDTATGLVSVAPGLTPGVYTLEYRICTNPNPTNCDTAIVTVLVVQPSVQIDKQVKSNDGVVGGFISYEITVTNDGDVELQNVEVADNLTGDTWTVPSLAPQASVTFEAQLEITQEMIEGVCMENVATATVYLNGEDSEQTTVLTEASDSAEACFAQNPDITIEKTAGVSTVDAAGQVITYTLTVTNTGNVTLNNVTVTDPLTGLNQNIGSLNPGISQ